MSPVLFILTLKEEYYPTLWKVVRFWSKILIYGMGFRLNFKLDQEIEPNKSYMFCPNHGSLMDGFVLVASSKNPIVFVGKKELEKIPIFGFFYKRVVIMVDRSSAESRKKVYEKAKKRLKNGTSIGIFPEGLVPTEDVILAPFKNGAFSLAIEHQIPIVCLTLPIFPSLTNSSALATAATWNRSEKFTDQILPVSFTVRFKSSS